MTILPNAFQTPNAHVDIAMQYLTGDEYKVLNFATRHILGWQDKIAERSGAISLTTFENGWSDFGGCGLARATIIKILEVLNDFGLLIRIGDPTSKGQKYSIGTEPNWQKMVARNEERQQKNRERIEKARSSRSGLLDKTGVVAQTDAGLSDKTGSGLSDKTHTKPFTQPNAKPISDTPQETPPTKQPRKQNLIFNAIRDGWGLSEGSFVAKLEKLLLGKFVPSGKKKDDDRDKLWINCNLGIGMTVDELNGFVAWYKRKGISFPTSPETIQRNVYEYRGTQTPRTIIEPVPEPTPIYEQNIPDASEDIDFEAMINDIAEAKRV